MLAVVTAGGPEGLEPGHTGHPATPNPSCSDSGVRASVAGGADHVFVCPSTRFQGTDTLRAFLVPTKPGGSLPGALTVQSVCLVRVRAWERKITGKHSLLSPEYLVFP